MMVWLYTSMPAWLHVQFVFLFYVWFLIGLIIVATHCSSKITLTKYIWTYIINPVSVLATLFLRPLVLNTSLYNNWYISYLLSILMITKVYGFSMEILLMEVLIQNMLHGTAPLCMSFSLCPWYSYQRVIITSSSITVNLASLVWMHNRNLWKSFYAGWSWLENNATLICVTVSIKWIPRSATY